MTRAGISAEERERWRRLRTVGLIGAEADRLCDALDAADAMAEAAERIKHTVDADGVVWITAEQEHERATTDLIAALATYRQKVEPEERA